MENRITEIIIRVLQHIQTEEEMSVFLQWYHTSQENKQFYFEMKKMYDRRKGNLMPSDKEMEDSWERLQRKLDTRHAYDAPQLETSRRPLFRRIRYASIAAIAILLLISGIWFFRSESDRIVWVEERATIGNTPRTILLPDGSTVQLNASSVLKYPRKFHSKNREVYLDGEAYFSVTQDPHHPFIVHTDQQAIHVLGTEFNVMGYSSDPYTVTTLVNGKIKLETFDNSQALKNEIILQPNQQVYFDKESDEATVSDTNALDATLWMKGIYAFKDTPLEEITRRLEKIYGVTIIADEAYKNEKYTGKFFTRQTIEEIMDILNFKHQFSIQLKNDTIILQE